MKKLQLSLSVLALLGASLYFASCSKSSDPGPQVLLPKLDGFYVYGTNTVASAPTDSTARMNLAVLDHSQGPLIDQLTGVYGRLIYIGANSTINFARVIDEKGTAYGAKSGGSVDSASQVPNVNEKDVVVHGTLQKNGDGIKITEEGLYYTFVKANTDTMEFVIMKLRPYVTGDYNNWGKPGYTFGFALSTVKSTSIDSTVFEGTNIPMKATLGYKYVYNHGWAIYQDPNIVTLSSLGVFSYGDSWAAGWNDIGLYNDNIPQHDDGMFTVRLSYKASDNSWKETKIKTAELPTDYTNVHVGLEGNAYAYAPGDSGTWAGNGTDGYGVKLPTASGAGKIFTWTWTNVGLAGGHEFIFLQDATWSVGLQLDYNHATPVTINGTAITGSEITDGNPNFHVAVGGNYDLKLVIDQSASPFTKTITIDNH